MQQRMDTKKLTMLAMLSALAYLMMVVGRIPVILFLKYDPKDIVITIGGFLFGPLAAFFMSITVSLVEMLTVSDTGWIGLVMNVLSTCSFACAAAIIYQKRRSQKRAISGLIIGALLMTIVMLLWNYFLTPLFMGLPRADVAKMLIPAFLPFNLLKGGLNAAITMLVYKPLSNALRKARLLPAPENRQITRGKVSLGVVLLSCAVIVTCVLFILVLQGRI